MTPVPPVARAARDRPARPCLDQVEERLEQPAVRALERGRDDDQGIRAGHVRQRVAGLARGEASEQRVGDRGCDHAGRRRGRPRAAAGLDRRAGAPPAGRRADVSTTASGGRRDDDEGSSGHRSDLAFSGTAGRSRLRPGLPVKMSTPGAARPRDGRDSPQGRGEPPGVGPSGTCAGRSASNFAAQHGTTSRPAARPARGRSRAAARRGRRGTAGAGSRRRSPGSPASGR